MRESGFYGSGWGGMFGSEMKVIRSDDDVTMKDPNRGTEDGMFCAREDVVDSEEKVQTAMEAVQSEKMSSEVDVSEAGMVDAEGSRNNF